MTDQADIAKLLLEHKANVDYRDKQVSSTCTLHSSVMSEIPTVLLILESVTFLKWNDYNQLPKTLLS